jgi:hypothetical protein
MKSLIVATVLALTGSLVHAQKIEKFDAVCADSKAIQQLLRDYQEVPALEMVSVREQGSRTIENPAGFFINYETKTWSFIEKTGQNKFCIIAVGGEIAPKN